MLVPPQALVEEATSKKISLLSLHELATEVLALPASQEDKETIRTFLQRLTADWEEMCQQFPTNIQVALLPPTSTASHLRPPEEFEDISEMVEWLILVESNLQPQPLTVPDTEQVKSMLKEILVSTAYIHMSVFTAFLYLSGNHDGKPVCLSVCLMNKIISGDTPV